MRKNYSARRTAFTGVMFALALVLQFTESMIPSPFPSVPGIKLGLSNIVTMFSLFTVGIPDAFLIAVLKGVFAFITRGPSAGTLSLAGGLLSMTAMTVCAKLGRSRGFTGIIGAVFHNLGQLAAECLMLKSTAALYYAPVLIISGTVMGTVTAYILRVLDPYLERLYAGDGERSGGQ